MSRLDPRRLNVTRPCSIARGKSQKKLCSGVSAASHLLRNARDPMSKSKSPTLKHLSLTVLTLMFALSLCGCVLVGGYRSGSGFFVWPGSLAVAVVALLLVFVFRRR